MVVPRDKDGRQRHVRDIDQKLVPFRPEGIYPGNLVGVVSGEHEGMYARVVDLLADEKIRIRFDSEEVRSQVINPLEITLIRGIRVCRK